MEHFRLRFEPMGEEVVVHAGATILEAAGEAGVVLDAVCGGVGVCGRCVVKLEPGGEEVLACQYNVDRDMRVWVPKASLLYEHKIVEEAFGQRRGRAAAGGEVGYGAAVDVGTTTVVVKLVDLESGEMASSASAVNPQRRFGDDVISRIRYAGDGDGLGRLRDLIRECVDSLVGRACEEAGAARADVRRMAVVGNTAMNHILRGLSVEQLGRAPYQAFTLEGADVEAAEVGVELGEAAVVHFLPNVAGFVGADTVAAALALDMGEADGDGTGKVRLMVDIGTNGEMVMEGGGGLWAASCAAGPALEGARIRCGSSAMAGAIEAVVLNADDIDVDVIGGGTARSIAGSGLIDAAAVLVELGVVEANGRMRRRGELEGISAKLAGRMIEVDGAAGFVLAGEGAERVYLTQKDIREVQLAKGAIRAGVELLVNKVGLGRGGIDEVLLAGAFGSFIRAESALRIGLLPESVAGKIRFVGNAACAGAEMALVSEDVRRRAAELAKRMEYVEIANDRGFVDLFADSMMLG